MKGDQYCFRFFFCYSTVVMALILDDDGLLDAADGFAGWDDALADDALAEDALVQGMEQERAAALESELEQLRGQSDRNIRKACNTI